MSDKVALVTGASRGIGYFSSVALAEAGAHVIAVARTTGGLEELDDKIQACEGSATLVPLDLLEHDAIDAMAASIHQRWGKLDILIGNAGMLGSLSPVDHFEPKTFEKVLALNVTANWRLMRAFSPLLRQSENGRAVFLTASSDGEPRPFWGAYAASNSALQSLVKTWAAETRKTTLRVNLLDPGPTSTALRASAMPGEDKKSIQHPSQVGEKLLPLCMDAFTKTGEIIR